jgi:hypothetical protein
MFMKGLLTLAGAALLALPFAALPQSSEQLVERYTTLAGSKQNATSLVTGLRDGKQVKLTRGTSTKTFTPPTGKMGYGNVDSALALAEASLKEQGIAKPTPAQLEKSLMDILKMRADGKGWGQIAHSLGFKPGDVKRSDKAEPRAGRPDRVAKTERPHKPEKPERPEKPR